MIQHLMVHEGNQECGWNDLEGNEGGEVMLGMYQFHLVGLEFQLGLEWWLGVEGMA